VGALPTSVPAGWRGANQCFALRLNVAVGFVVVLRRYLAAACAFFQLAARRDGLRFFAPSHRIGQS
jgi:hypothetical protein